MFFLTSGMRYDRWNCYYSLILLFYTGGSEIRVERSPSQRIHGTAWGKRKIVLGRATILGVTHLDIVLNSARNATCFWAWLYVEKSLSKEGINVSWFFLTLFVFSYSYTNSSTRLFTAVSFNQTNIVISDTFQTTSMCNFGPLMFCVYEHCCSASNIFICHCPNTLS